MHELLLRLVFLGVQGYIMSEEATNGSWLFFFSFEWCNIWHLTFWFEVLCKTQISSWLVSLHKNPFSWNFQGRVVPCDFIGVVKSQQPVYLKGTQVIFISCFLGGTIPNLSKGGLFILFSFFLYLFIYNLNFHWIGVAGEVVSNHDELMSNFFAQPDALAYGKVWWTFYHNIVGVLFDIIKLKMIHVFFLYIIPSYHN